MRIVQLVTQSRGGPTDHAVDVAVTLARRGHDSHLVGPVAHRSDRLAAAGVTWHDIAIEHSTDIRGARELRRLLRRLDADVLHCQDMRAGLVGRLIGRRTARVVVYTVHGVPDGLSDLVPGNARIGPKRRRDRLRYLAGERWIARLTNARYVVPCTPVGDYLIDHVGLPSASITVVHNGVDPDRFAPSDASGDPDAQRVTTLWLGLMGPIKRVDRLIRAAAAIPQLELLLVGGGTESELVARLADELGVADRVRMQAHVERPDELFAAAELFALPSAAEACPLALLQAMSCGLPVVASRVGGIPEVVRSDTDGLLVDSQDEAGFIHALSELVADSGRRTLMGKQARERIVSSFSLELCVDRLLDVYRA